MSNAPQSLNTEPSSRPGKASAQPLQPETATRAQWLGTILFDYAPKARVLWCSLTLAGLLALLWACSAMAAEPSKLPYTLLVMGVAVAAAMIPVRIPQSRHSVSLADVCLYLAMAWLGPAAAVVASGLESFVTTARFSQRWSSRIVSPAANMAAMAMAGLAFQQIQAQAQGVLGAETALVLALGAAALVMYAVSTFALWSTATLKSGRRIQVSAWFGEFAWVGTVAQASALVAALVVINARLFGLGLIVAVLGLVAISVWLLKVSFSQREAAQAAQDAKLATANREAQINQQRFMAAYTHAAVGMATVGPDRRVIQVNPALTQLLGSSESELVGHDFHRYMHPGDLAVVDRLMDQLAQQPNENFSVQIRCFRRDGEELWVALHCSRFEDPGSGGQCVIYQLHDITSRHLAEQRLHHIAFHDSLTDLANRAYFTERLTQTVERSRTDPQARFAVLFLDLDRFKVVNDSLGHQAGNELLIQVASRLRQCVRPQDLVARLGGDEFAVLCEGLDQHADARNLAQRMGQSLSRPLAIHGTEVVPGASIGITFGDLGYRTVDEILRDADLAMYEAKAAGRGRVAVFDASMHERIADRLALEADLRHAVGEGKFSAVFQPIYALNTMQLAGFEALARWEHPTRGPINPAVFITLAEEAGHIEGVTRWMIDHAVSQLAQWRREHPTQVHLTMNVNLSARDLSNPELAGFVRSVLDKHNLPPDLLTLEITETTVMNHLKTALATLQALRTMGVHFSIDDFGTGYSSLAYLGTLPIDSLKIDRSFVQGMDQGSQNVEIVRAVLKLGHTLGKNVVAEGIETPEQLERLQRMGVDRGQGYLMSKPLPAEKIRALLVTRAALVPA